MQDDAEAFGRTEPLDFLSSYSDSTLTDPTVDVERHRNTLGELEEAGLTWVIVTHPRCEPAVLLDWLAAFGSEYIGR